MPRPPRFHWNKIYGNRDPDPMDVVGSLSPPATRAVFAGARLRVAVVGGGITGLALAIGLRARGVACTVYERAAAPGDVGAGIGFSPNAERAMRALAPEVHAAFKCVANPNGEDYFQWIDGQTDELVYKLHMGTDAFQGCKRSDFVAEMVKLLPEEAMRSAKKLRALTELASGKVVLSFDDGTDDWADVVVGCDGIRSCVRRDLLGPGRDATYTHKYCFRALVPMDKAAAALGHYRTSTRFMYCGPDAHAITYPIATNTILNVLLVISDPNPWVEEGEGRRHKHTASGTRAEAVAAFAEWHPTVRALAGLMPAHMDKWAVFDMAEPTVEAPTYALGSCCLAGDAAHAVGPHLGSGGGLGIEDALCLAMLLTEVDRRVAGRRPGHGDSQEKAERDGSRAGLVRHALAAYSQVRMRRTQNIVRSTRSACDLFQWKGGRPDDERFATDVEPRFRRVWDHDLDYMVKQALDEFAARAGDPVSRST